MWCRSGWGGGVHQGRRRLFLYFSESKIHIYFLNWRSRLSDGFFQSILLQLTWCVTMVPHLTRISSISNISLPRAGHVFITSEICVTVLNFIDQITLSLFANALITSRWTPASLNTDHWQRGISINCSKFKIHYEVLLASHLGSAASHVSWSRRLCNGSRGFQFRIICKINLLICKAIPNDYPKSTFIITFHYDV